MAYCALLVAEVPGLLSLRSKYLAKRNVRPWGSPRHHVEILPHRDDAGKTVIDHLLKWARITHSSELELNPSV